MLYNVRREHAAMKFIKQHAEFVLDTDVIPNRLKGMLVINHSSKQHSNVQNVHVEHIEYNTLFHRQTIPKGILCVPETRPQTLTSC